MAFGNTIVQVKLSSITLESLTSVKLKYSIGLLDNNHTVYYLLPVNDDSFSILIALTAGQPIPTFQDICNVIENDLEMKFGGLADTVEIDGVVYPFPPILPGP